MVTKKLQINQVLGKMLHIFSNKAVVSWLKEDDKDKLSQRGWRLGRGYPYKT